MGPTVHNGFWDLQWDHNPPPMGLGYTGTAVGPQWVLRTTMGPKATIHHNGSPGHNGNATGPGDSNGSRGLQRVLGTTIGPRDHNRTLIKGNTKGNGDYNGTTIGPIDHNGT